MFKRIACLIVSFLLVMTLLTGCQSGGGTAKETDAPVSNPTTKPTEKPTEKPAEETAPPEEEKKPVEISIAWENIQGIDEDDIGKYVQDLFKMDIVPIAADGEQLNLMAVSDSLPDVFTSSIGTAAFNKFIGEGFVREIPEDMFSKYPKLKAIADNHEVGKIHRDMTGKIYGIPRPANTDFKKDAMEAAIYYREDWRKELGIAKVPETIEEFYDMLKAFASKEGVYGMSGWVWQAHLIPWVDYGNWIYEDGQWIPGYLSKDVVPALEFFNRLYKEKILDPEFTVSPPRDMFFQGKIGAMVGNASTYWLWNNITVGFQGANPEADAMEDVKLLPPLQGFKDGKPKWVRSMSTGMILISEKVEDERLERLLEFLEWCLSDEGRDLSAYGFLDVDYVLKDQKAVSILPYKSGEYGRQQPIWEKYPSVNLFSLLSYEMPPATQPLNPILPDVITELNLQFQKVTHGPAAVPVNVLVNNIQTPAKEVNTIGVGEAETEFNRIISTDNPAQEFEVIKKKWLEVDGLQQVIDEVNQVIKEQGIK